MSLDPAFIKKVQVIAATLDQLDYFQLLALTPEADAATIRAAYHRQARRFHPDRYQHLGDAALVADLTRVSKRVTEAYVVLRDDAKRKRYIDGITGPDRAARLRFGEADEAQERQAKEEETGKTPQVKQFYNSARLAHANGDLQGALKNLKMALMYEPDNSVFKELLVAWSEESKK